MLEGARVRRNWRRGLDVAATSAIMMMLYACAANQPSARNAERLVRTQTPLFVSPQDGRVSRDEFLADSEAFFAKLDADKDGYVTSYEETQYDAKIAPELNNMYAPMEDFVGPGEADKLKAANQDTSLTRGERDLLMARPLGAQAFGWLNEVEPVMSADADLNGKVSLGEFQAAGRRRFDRLDANHDGYFTLSEAPAPLWRSAGNTK